VTNGVYRILRSALIEHSATLSYQQFSQIFANDKKYEKQRHYTWLVDLLKQFQLAFDLSKADHTILIPSRLPSVQPDFNLSWYQTGLNFRFEYQRILKKNVLSQFIVLMHEYVTSNSLRFWQRGIFLHYKGTDAVAISDEAKKTITIAINNADRHGSELLTIIRHCIRGVNSTNTNYINSLSYFSC
jgi:hypothetical protein